MIKQFNEKPKPKKLIKLESQILDYIYADEMPEDEKVIKILDEIFIIGYDEALKFTWEIEDPDGKYIGEIVRTGVNEFVKI